MYKASCKNKARLLPSACGVNPACGASPYGEEGASPPCSAGRSNCSFLRRGGSDGKITKLVRQIAVQAT